MWPGVLWGGAEQNRTADLLHAIDKKPFSHKGECTVLPCGQPKHLNPIHPVSPVVDPGCGHFTDTHREFAPLRNVCFRARFPWKNQWVSSARTSRPGSYVPPERKGIRRSESCRERRNRKEEPCGIGSCTAWGMGVLLEELIEEFVGVGARVLVDVRLNAISPSTGATMFTMTRANTCNPALQLMTN